LTSVHHFREVYLPGLADEHQILHAGIGIIDENFICSNHACFLMVPKMAPKKSQKKKRRKKTGSLTVRAITGMLSAALKNHDDFILTWEPRPGEEVAPGTKQEIHIMTGNLITFCRLNNLKSRVLLYEDEGAQLVSRVWD
jgi:hypothetical protein